MFAFKKARRAEADKFRKALDRSLAIVEFDPAGQILDANDNFCKVMGYAREEILGKSHRLFVDPAYVQSAAYREFWAKLGRGQFDDSQYKRIGKNGREIWIQASYNPILNARGVVERVVKVAADITPAKLRNVEFEAKLNAISLVQAIIEFTPDGEILTANENFLEAMGYALDEIRGRHHRVFVDAKFAQSPEYAAFWAKLKRGEFVSDTFRRLGKGGAPILLQASYNPIFDLNGKVMKIVKFATDISDLADLGAGLSQLAAGDMERPIAESFRPMFEPIRHDFNRAQSRLRSTLGRIVDCAAAVADGGKRVSSASEDLARRTEQQAVSLEETAAALGGVNQTVKKTASGAGQARDVTSETRGDAERSGEIVRRAIDAMGKIEGSSQRIGQIIGVIDEIAFQTNLLALNAGVEAARAGEAGRGFAVVASEVRALAQRSAGAAKEIKQLVSASTEEVGEGVKFVGATGESLARIIAKVGKINTLIAEIASGAEGQSTALHDVNAAVTTMDRAVQQNAAVAQETTAASRSLLEEAETLAELAHEFRTGREKAFNEPPRPVSRHFAA